MSAMAAALLRAGMTSGTIMSAADVLAQAIASVAFSSARLDWRRTLRFFLLGLTADGPFWHTGFGLVERVYGPSLSVSGRVLWRVLIQKTLCAQFLLNPPYLIILFTYLGALEGKTSPRALAAHVGAQVPPALKGGMAFWSVANAVNFRFVPPSRRVLFSGVAGALWSTYFSWLTKRVADRLEKKSAAAPRP